MRRLTSTLVALAIALVAAPAALAAQKDYVIPDAPAFTFLGGTPTQISRPSSARDLAVALADGVDAQGRVQRGVALDVMPWLIFPRRVTNKAYRENPWEFIYANFELSLGTLRPSGDSTATSIALGLKTNLVNHADPLTDDALGRAIEDSVAECQTIKDANGRPQGDLIEACADRVTDKLIRTWMDDGGHWNDLAVTVAAAWGGEFARSEISQLSARSGAAWATVALPLGERAGQLLIQARTDVGRDTSSFSGGAHAAFGTTRINGFGEVIGAWRNRGPNTGAQWSAGIEFKAADALWLSAGFGTRYDALANGTRTVVIANVKWNVAKNSVLNGQ